MGRARWWIAIWTIVVLGAGAGPVHAEEPVTVPAVTSVQPPQVSGVARYDSVLTATAGTWDPAPTTLAYRWLRDGAPIGGATSSTYRLKAKDIGTRTSVRVTATAPERTDGTAASAPTALVGSKQPTVRTKPSISGTRRFASTLTADPGRWSVSGLRFSYRWLRDGRTISGATSRRYQLAASDVGHRIAVRVQARRTHHRTTAVSSVRTGTIKHRRDVRRTITYRVARNGSTASLATFRKLAAETFADPRGWRSGGIRFKEVKSGGAFTLVLAKASRVPSYSSGCSATYSCRVGRNVIINETRWQKATAPWNRAGGSLRGYRHMVVNHESGHFLGKGHVGCSKKGAKAPIMMQQSKGLGGCTFNPWPLARELR